MKKGLLLGYMTNIADETQGESWQTIFKYMLPEMVTALLLYSMPMLIDACFIGYLKSTPTYAALGVTNNLLNLLIKMAEAFGVGMVVLGGHNNGHGDYNMVGRALRDAFWVTCILGAAFAGALYFGAYFIYNWYNFTPDVIEHAVPFLQLRAVSIFFMFICFAFIGFLRGIKNTQMPMKIFIAGALVFIGVDYLLIFGKFGFPALGLQGSAVASIAQYFTMLLMSVAYVMSNKEYRKYGIDLLAPMKDGALAKRLIALSLPIMLDKSILAFAYIWLCKMIGLMGTNCTATFCVIRDMERLAIFPALAGAQVIILLVSNDFGAKNWPAIKSNIRKIIFLASVMVFCLLVIMAVNIKAIVQIFDKKGDFIGLASTVFPVLSGFVFFDLLQLILSGALRGAGNVKTVMLVRLATCTLYFMPFSYLMTQLPVENQIIRFILVYGSFFIGNALMSLFYIKRFCGHEWRS